MEPSILGLTNNEATVFLFADDRGYIPFPAKRSADDDAVLLQRLRNLLDKGYVRKEIDRDGYVIFFLTDRGKRMKAKLEDIPLD